MLPPSKIPRSRRNLTRTTGTPDHVMSLRSLHSADTAASIDFQGAEEATGLESGAFEAPTEIIRDVLVVEPDPEAQTALSRALALPGRRLVGTSSAEGAYAFLRANPPDAIFVSSENAGMDPLDFCAHLRELCPAALIVFMTEKDGNAAQRALHGVDVELSHAEILDLPPGTLEYLRLTSMRSAPRPA